MNKAMMIILGVILIAVSGCSLYWMAVVTWGGFAGHDIWMLAGGGLLLLLFGSLAAGGVVTGVMLIAWGMDWI